MADSNGRQIPCWPFLLVSSDECIAEFGDDLETLLINIVQFDKTTAAAKALDATRQLTSLVLAFSTWG